MKTAIERNRGALFAEDDAYQSALGRPPRLWRRGPTQGAGFEVRPTGFMVYGEGPHNDGDGPAWAYYVHRDE